MIGNVRLINGLYYFEDDLQSNKMAHGLSSISSLSLHYQIMIWHYRLGHPNFFYLNICSHHCFKRQTLCHFNVKVVFWQKTKVSLTFQTLVVHQDLLTSFIVTFGTLKRPLFMEKSGL